MERMKVNYTGVVEAIMLNDRGCVAEGTADNLFIVQEGKLLTPPTTEGALAVITRSVVLDLALNADIQASESILTSYDLYIADECFLTGTGAKLIPVREIDGRQVLFCPGKVYLRLAEAFAKLVRRETT
jgi:branched-chain amino acid aminotransferase